MRRLGLLLLLCGCYKHGVRAEAAARHARPDCAQVGDARLAPGEGWLWNVPACGELLLCTYDDRGAMACGVEVPEQVAKPARFIARCDVGRVDGVKVSENEWAVYLCGHALRCADVGDAWQCRDER
jgi:hypothetical protein